MCYSYTKNNDNNNKWVYLTLFCTVNIHIMYWDPSIHNINDIYVVMGRVEVVMGRVEVMMGRVEVVMGIGRVEVVMVMGRVEVVMGRWVGGDGVVVMAWW